MKPRSLAALVPVLALSLPALAQQTPIFGIPGAPGSATGTSVDADGGRLILGQPGNTPGFARFLDLNDGAVFDFQGPNGVPLDPSFGASVAISGNWMLIGAPAPGVPNGGAVFLFRRASDGTWSQEPILGLTGTSTGLGRSVDMDGTHAVVASESSVLTLVRSTDGAGNPFWQVESDLSVFEGKPVLLSDPNVAIEWRDSGGFGRRVVIGDADNNFGGVVYVWKWDGAAWVEELDPITGSGATGFGSAVSVVQDTIAVGEPFAGGGRVHLYRPSGSGWSEEAELLVPGGLNEPAARFGTAVDLGVSASGRVHLLAGAPGTTLDDPAVVRGSAPYYGRYDGQWDLLSEYVAPLATDDAGFGSSVAIDLDIDSLQQQVAAIGAPADSLGAGLVQVRIRILGDVDLDGLVGTDDLLAVLGAWGPCPPMTACPADLNDDGAVDVSDLLLVLSNWSEN